MPGILGRKIGMTHLIQDDGRVIPLTVVACGPNVVVQIKTQEKDGYPALVLGFDALKKPTKNRKYRHLKEFRIPAEDESLKTGDDVKVDIFEVGERTKITSVSKGKGFQGVIKRHNFSRGPETHGSHHHREPGSVGACTRPGRIHKGKKMPGRMGTDTKTLENVEIVYLDLEKNLLGLKGAVSGSNGSLVIIRKK
jgi:large subunit ribosomal protein L3